MVNSQSDLKTFSVRIVSMDYYMCPPIPGLDISYSSFQGGKVNEVPVIRVYGSTPAGQKTCLHIHGALPYFYVPCSDLFLQPDQEGEECTRGISHALEKALKLKGNVASKRQHVHSCSLVRAKKFYEIATELLNRSISYYPQDVSRAANLLLGGAVLDRVLQPHESHIPFLLQFMVDYNLYGMGHLHVSKMKFRYPVPDTFSPRKPNHNEPKRTIMDIPANTSADFQADSGYDPYSDPPIWISSTIPDGWVWLYSSQDDSSSDQALPAMKRSSTSALEGDAVVDAILNQQFLSYTSLSQTCSKVRMIQSLIPIWEEFERNGMHELALPPDPGKPLPVDVLRILSNGIGFEDIFLEPDNAAALCFHSQSINSSTEQGKSFQDDDMGKSNEKTNAYPSQLSTECLEISDNIQLSSGVKVSDHDALGILNWLASSQAAEDINSDDDLARETILSPLMPATTLDKVLEKAHADYENESQQECEDILDTVQDRANIEGFDGRAADLIDSNHSCKTSSDRMIPQVDGSSDSFDAFSCAGKSHHESGAPSGTDSWHDAHLAMISNRKKRRQKWGSLPVSSGQRTSDLSPSTALSTISRCGNHIKDDSGLPYSVGSGANLSPSIVKGSTKEIMVNCSMRDLMRKKRYYRAEPSECRAQIKKSPSDEEDKGSLYIGQTLDEQYKIPFAYSMNMNSGGIQQRECDETNSCTAFQMHYEPYDAKTDNLANGKLPIYSGHCNTLPRDSSNVESCHTFGGSDVRGVSEADVDLQNSGFSGAPLLNKKTDPSEQYSHIKSSVLFHMLNHQNLQVRINLLVVRKCSNVMQSIQVANLLQLEKGVPDELRPFFGMDCLVEGDCYNCRTLDHNHCQGDLLGAPIHYQNDGSYLFMLTPVFRPPQAKCVERWLTLDSTDVSEENKVVCPALAPSIKESSSEAVGLQNSRALSGSQPLIEAVPASDLKPNLDLINQQHKGSHNMELEHFHDGIKVIPQCKEDMLKCKPSTDFSEDISQISGPDRKSKLTPLSQIGFRDSASIGCGQQLTLLSIEVQAECRGDLRPDPRFDAVSIIVLVIQEDDDPIADSYVLLHCNGAPVQRNLYGLSGCKLLGFSEERHLFTQFVKIFSCIDPDVLMGWDIQGGSLGFLAERAAHLGFDLLNKISRTPSVTNATSRCYEEEKLSDLFSESIITDSVLHDDAMIIDDEWGRTHASGIHVGGRIVLNIWRLMRGEVKLNMYTMETVAEAVLRRKVPSIPSKVLTNWFLSGPGRARFRCIEYILDRAKLNLQIMTQLDMINRTSELARIFGIDFFSVLSRGSQYRVESMFLRLAHTQNYIAISPGNQQVAFQPAMECLPLVMEPESGFYADPVVVLDFQSLYPSMIIAYNLCYSTCLGKVTASKSNILGVSSYSPDRNVLRKLKHKMLLTPNGVMFVPSEVRKGVLPRLLEELLSTRIMVKQAMKKLAASEKVLHRIFNARQLALKLISNVTYGYTAAGFSGRMPCAELADCIVQCGRRTLENAISFVNTNDKWKAKVIYGDTDSMFVLLKGRSLKEAFQIGHEIASEVSAMSPNPVTLKMEKVYHPCFLITKKRYVGYSYESPDQSKPIFDAKGIETVRRDSCGAVCKTMERSLRLFFEHHDIEKVKSYLLRQWKRIMSGRVDLQDFVFAKEVRLGTYRARASSLPPAAIVATKAMRTDPRAEPRYAERVPYVVVHGEPGARLADVVVDPLDLLTIDSPYRVNDMYYIQKQIIPALQRVFGLVGADLNQWLQGMPRPEREAIGKRGVFAPNAQRTRIDYYYLSKHCILCGELVQAFASLCHNCSKNEASVAVALTGRTSKLERDIHHLVAICRHCGGGDWVLESGVKCTSLACSIFYERRKIQKELQSLSAAASEAGFYPGCVVEWF
nr:DNA polymerase zeta catalytic subunit isoform X1 [Ipomoea batatas]